jgi:hypothetical protein
MTDEYNEFGKKRINEFGKKRLRLNRQKLVK